MTASSHRPRGRQPDAAAHMFSVGQLVRIKSQFGVFPKTSELYRITGTLPAKDNSPQYRIRSDNERHERMATQDSLQAVAPPLGGNDATLAERTFGHGQGTETRQSRAPKTEAGEGPGEN
ncbi:hypothetical protein [Mesorhizobium sp. 1M-11]|uniref:hypothetical protein n=1 Tax=Mesorhizobium sp. 1M-11 TaxID=1529006 RepID=UPI0006C73BE2